MHVIYRYKKHVTGRANKWPYVTPNSFKFASQVKMIELNQFEQFLLQLKQRAKA